MQVAKVLKSGWVSAGLGLTLLWTPTACSKRVPVEEVLAVYQPGASYAALQLRQPQDGTVFPPDLAPFTFSWDQPSNPPNAWVILVEFEASAPRLSFVSDRPEWTPATRDWERIKEASAGKNARMTLLGVKTDPKPSIIARAQISFLTSKDPVGAPIFYREVNLPFKEAVKDPSRIRWRFGSVDGLQPPATVLQNLPVCGNCHSFSDDGRTLGMDVDYGNNKGSYVITRVAKEMSLASSDIITWDDYRKEEAEPTYGLLSRVSPDGQTVLSTVKDKSVFVPKPDLAFSQLFFPIKGIIAVHHRSNGTFTSLPGADDPQYVQSNPVWSPDGKYVVFARAEAYRLKSRASDAKLLLSEEDCAEFVRDGKPFKFDLYRVPYNQGRGGKAEPIRGASGNGRSNYFPKYSPDGKWIVFCQASNYMLLQPDSELFIIPPEGGEPRQLRCNTQRMNSWHSFSPNGRWLVFSSKANSPYTQLFLTHIDADGESTPPVVLSRFTAPDRAANIPEFVNAAPTAIARIREQFLNDYSHARSGYFAEKSGDLDKAIAEYEAALKINPANVHAHQRLGYLLYHARRDVRAGVDHTREALRLDPNDGCAQFDYGVALLDHGQTDEAITRLKEAVRLLPEGFEQRYSIPELNCTLAYAYSKKAMALEAAEALRRALAAAPNHARSHYLLALSLAAQGQLDEPLLHYSQACSLQPGIDTSPELHFLFSINYEKAGQYAAALKSAEKARGLVKSDADPGLLNALNERVATCRQRVR